MHPPYQQSPALSAAPGIRHGFFGRRGGVSEGEFSSLNASSAVGDDTANVTENIHRAVMALKGGPLPIALVRQVHGTEVLVVDKTYDIRNRPEADAMVTTRSGIALGILTADCVPVLLADPHAGVIGAAHAGWKGAVGGIVGKTVAAMTQLGARPGDIVAAIGPAISLAHYEIGDDMARSIRQNHPDAARFIDTTTWPKPHLDVPGLVFDQIGHLGLASVDALASCTYADAEAYFSHRHATHNHARAGRQISLIARG